MELNLISEFKAHPRHAQAVMFSHDGSELATTGMDALTQIWSVPAFDHLRSLRGHDKSVNAIALSPDGSTAVTGSTDRAVMVWDWKTGQPLHTLAGHRNTVAAVAFSPNGEVAATSSYGGRVGLWKPGADSLDIFRSHPRHVTSLSFSKDGDSLAAAGIGNIVKIWNIQTRELRHDIEAPGQAATSCLFLPNGNLCCATYEGEIAIYAAESYAPITSAFPQVGRISSATPLPGSNALFCSIEGGVTILDLDTMQTSSHYQTGIKGMYGVARSPDGALAAAASADGKCRVWEIIH